MEYTTDDMLVDVIEDQLIKVKACVDQIEKERLINDLKELTNIQGGLTDKKLKVRDLDLKEAELQLKLKTSKRDVFVAGIRIGVDVLGVVLPIMFYSKWMVEGLNFETTGTFTSQTFKGLIGKFKPTK